MKSTARAGRYLIYVSQPYGLPIGRPLQAAIRRAGGSAAWFFEGPGADRLRPDEQRLETVAQVKAFNPRAVFVPGNVVPDFFPGIKVEVFHGFSVGKRSDQRGHFRIRGLFDLYCTQGSTTTPTFKRLARRHGHFRVVETGWPKIDPLFRDEPRPTPRWRTAWSGDRPVILFASTFTAALSAAPLLRERIAALAANGPYNWLVTLHPKMPDEIVRSYRALQGSQLRFVDTEDTVPLLQAADAMLSDTSSIVFEFLMQHRPAVTLRNTRPGSHLVDIRSPDELGQALEHALSRPGELMRGISEFTQHIHPYRDGLSSERVLAATQQLIADGGSNLRRKPLNLVRRIQLRQKLGYYGW